MSTTTPRKVGVVYDWENTIRTSTDVRPYGHDHRCRQTDPLALAHILVERAGAGLGVRAELAQVFIAAGIHSPFQNRRQWQARHYEARRWNSHKLIHAETRELVYGEGTCRESAAIDQLVADKTLELSRSSELDLLIVFTNDRGIARATHDAFRFGRCKINAATWSDKPSVLFRKGLYVHHLTEQDYLRSSTPSPIAA
ncbi:hypothetical protein [Lolliginicoccus levis]|uniref:hypothetical protein n=1 Tax=Lolliginicoccus levis TaxID=2919542 RepID=UPI00241FEE9A|nr:hypothetical protein [Lolliginicoccus levis]